MGSEGRGWMWPIDANGEAIGAPIEIRDADMSLVRLEPISGRVPDDGGWCAPTETPDEMLAEYRRQRHSVPKDSPSACMPCLIRVEHEWTPFCDRPRRRPQIT